MEETLKKYMDGYLKKNREWNDGTAMLLLALKAMFEATGDTYYKESILECMEEFIDGERYADMLMPVSHRHNITGGRLLNFAYQMTRNEKYKKSMAQVIQATEEELSLVPEAFYMNETFYLLYETDYNNKEGYNRIHGHFRELESLLLKVDSFNDMGWFMMAVIDSYGIISEQIFEQMKYLQKLFKDYLKIVLDRNLIGKSQSDMGALMVSYSIMKGCRLEAISEEKYFNIGAEIFQKYLNEPEHNGSGRIFKDQLIFSLFIMAYSEVILNKRERSSVRF